MDKLLEQIKANFPQKAIDISESLELLKESISDTIEKISVKTKASMDSRDFEKSKVYSQMAEEVYIYESKIDEIKNKLDVAGGDIEEETDEETEKRTIPDYSQYTVDYNIEHTLYEDFTHKRPFGFKINNNHIIEVKTWQGMLVKTCEYLIAIDKDKFLSFEDKPSMNGKKNKYFSTNPKNIRKPRKLGDKIYVEINLSGNAIRNLIIKLLKEYGFKINEYKVYFRADYSNLNRDD